MTKLVRLLVVIVLVLVVSPAWAQWQVPISIGQQESLKAWAPNIYVKADCTTVVAPALYARCFSTTRGVWLSYDGTGWRSDAALATKIRNPVDYGADPTGVADSTAAFQAAIDSCGTGAQGSGTLPNVNGGTATNQGCTIWVPPGIFKAIVTMRPYLTLEGSGRWVSRIVSPTVQFPAIRGTNAGWIRIAHLDIEGAGGIGGDGIYLANIAGPPFGLKFTLENLNIYGGYNGINLFGSATNTTIKNVYIRNPSNNGIEHTGGTISAPDWSGIYISQAGARCMSLEGGGGSGQMGSVITESCGTDAWYLNGWSRFHFLGPYVGDSYGTSPTGGYGWHFVNSYNITVSNSFHLAGSYAQSHILFDGSYDIVFDGVDFQGGPQRYDIESNNVSGTPANQMRFPNRVRRIHWSGAPGLLGPINDTLSPPNIVIEDAPVIYGLNANNTNNLTVNFLTELYAQETVIRHNPSPPADTGLESFAPMNSSYAWGFLERYPGVANNALLAMGGGGVATYPSSETLGANLITGQNVSCAGGVGSWTASGAAVSITSDASGCKFAVVSGAGSIALSLATLAANKVYLLTFDAQPHSAVGSTFGFTAGNNADNATLRASQSIQSTTASAYKSYQLRWVADGANSVLRMTVLSPGNGDYVFLKNFSLTEVKSAGSLSIMGGRQCSTGVGGGGCITLYGADHVTKPNYLELTGTLVSVSGKIGPSGTQQHTLPAVASDTVALLGATQTFLSGSTWNGAVIGPVYGGTGIANNAASTLTILGNFGTTLTVTGATSVTLPTSGTLVNSAVATLSSLASVGTITTGTWSATAIANTKGGTGTDSSGFTGLARVTSGTWSAAATGYGRVVYSATSPTTVSGVMADLTGASITFTTGARPVTCGFSGTVSNSGLGNATDFQFTIDGATDTAVWRYEEMVANQKELVGFTHQTAALTAASHTFKVQWATNAGTSTMQSAAGWPYSFWCKEVQ